MEPLASLLSSSESAVQPVVAIRAAGLDGADAGAVFSLARALREAGVSIQLVGAADDSPNEITASSEGFSLKSKGAEARRLTRTEEVVRAVSDAGHD
jgi:hypothetical protein